MWTGSLLLTALVAGILLPGEAAYIGAYIAMAAGALALLAGSWQGGAGYGHPVSLAILLAIGLVAATLPFVYRGSADLLAPLFILPMLTTIGLGLLAAPGRWLPSPLLFALICLAASFIAAAGGIYEHLVLGSGRVGLSNNPIHYGSLAAMAGCLALVGVVATGSPWRYVFLLGPIFGLGAAILSGSRGPLAGVLVMSCIGIAMLLVWLWRESWFRLAVLAALCLGAAAMAYLVGTGNNRVMLILDTAMNIFRFTGSSEDIRTALYASALEAWRQSPLFGLGYGQIMENAWTMFPDLVPTYLENLHADWANFMAMSGSLGLAAFVILLLAPFLLLLDPLVRADRPVVLGAVLLVTGQAVLGVSNAMFGVLPQTMLFAVALGYFLARARQLSMTEPASPQA